MAVILVRFVLCVVEWLLAARLSVLCPVCCFVVVFSGSWPRGYKTFFMHEIFSANKYENANIIGIFIFISREIFMPRYVYSKKEIAIVSNLRFISRTIFMLS